MKKKRTPTPEVEIRLCSGDDLQSLLNRLKDIGISSSEYPNLKFTLDFSACYYEGDWPEIILRKSKPNQ